MASIKRKWQIALRRFLVSGTASLHYQNYYGIGQKNFIKYIESQFDSEMNWDNYAEVWDFDHIIPVCYFDFSKDDELILCWNFLNIQACKLPMNKNRSARFDVPRFYTHFHNIYLATDYKISGKLAYKVKQIENDLRMILKTDNVISFLNSTSDDWETFHEFGSFKRLLNTN